MEAGRPCESGQTKSLVSHRGIRLGVRGQDLKLDPGLSQEDQGQEAELESHCYGNVFMAPAMAL